jgi:succinyl-diaminopimelate desuccinylase
MARKPMIEALDRAIGDREAAVVELTRALVAFPTINPPGEAYTPCAEYLGRRLEASGFAIAYVRGEGAPGDSDRYPRTNVIGRFETGRPGPTIHFNGHIDVVEVGRGWTVEPFAGVVANGRVYGRGTCDMKGGLAAAVVAMETLIASGLPLCGAIEISGTVDEESGGFGGVAHLARQGYFSKPRVDHVIIPEPLNVDRVCIGHRGVWWAEVETFGRIAHGSMPFLGDCAVRHMAAFIAELEAKVFPRLAERRTAMPVVPDGARASTLNLNGIQAGTVPDGTGLPSPCVPDRCRLTLDRRYLIEEDPGDVKAEIVGVLDALKSERHGFDYAISELMHVAPIMTEPTAPVPQAVAAAIRAVVGREAAIVASPGTYDQKHIARIGHLHDCVAYGPGILDLAHQPDEFVVIDDLVAAMRVMARATLALMGLTRN